MNDVYVNAARTIFAAMVVLLLYFFALDESSPVRNAARATAERCHGDMTCTCRTWDYYVGLPWDCPPMQEEEIGNG